MSDYYEHLEAAWNDLSKEDKERFISGNIRRQQPIPHNPQNHKPMTQEYSAEEIVKALADWSNKYPREKIYGAQRQPEMDGRLIEIEEMAKAYQQQPIPQDINKWLDETFPIDMEEKKSHQEYAPVMQTNATNWERREGAKTLAQLLLPQLQELREQKKDVKELLRQWMDENKQCLDEIEQQKSQIDTFTKTLVEYAEQIVKQEAERKERAAEIQALKHEILRLKEQHNKWARIYNDRLDNQP